MADIWLVQNFHQRLECPGGTDVARGDGSLHPDERAGIAGQAVENLFLVFEVCVPVAELMGGCGAGVVVVALEQLGEQLGVDGTDAAIKPYGLNLVVAMARVGRVELGHPDVEGCLGLGRVAVSQFALGPVAVAVLGALQNVEQLAKRRTVNLRHLLRLGPLGHDAENAAADPVSAFVAQRVLGVALDRVVPVADVHRSVGSVAQIDRNEAEVF